MATSPAPCSKHPQHLCHSLHVPKSYFRISCFLHKTPQPEISLPILSWSHSVSCRVPSLPLSCREPLYAPLPCERKVSWPARGKSLNQPEAPCGFKSSQLLPSLTRFINILSFSALCFLMKLLSQHFFRNPELNLNYAQGGLCSHIPLLLSIKHGMGESFSHTCSPTTVAPITAKRASCFPAPVFPGPSSCNGKASATYHKPLKRSK